MNKIRLLIIYPVDPFGEKIGGIETCIRDYIKESPKNFEIEIVGIMKRNSSLILGEWQDIVFEGKKIKFFPILSVGNLNIQTLIPLTLKFVIALFLSKRRIDFSNRVVIFHRLEPIYVLSNIKEKKILFVHGDIRNFSNKYSESRWKRIRGLYYLLEIFFIRKMQKVFVVSQKGCEYYRNRYLEHSSCFKFLPTWYDPAIFYKFHNIKKDEILSKYNIVNKKPIFLFVGRLDLPKDPILLLDSFYVIKKIYKNSQLLIIGNGILRSKIIERINLLSIGHDVVLLGELSHDKVAEIMNISDVLLSTSRFEGMSRVILESLACGLPVVATDVGESYLVVKNRKSGRLVSSWVPEEIAESAIDVISNPPSPKSCMSIVKKYTEKRVISQFFKEIEELIVEQAKQ